MEVKTHGGQIGRHTNPLHLKSISPLNLLSATIAFILLGLGLGYADLIKSITVWEDYYYMWDKLKDLLFVLTLRRFVPNKKAKGALKFLSYFFTCRILWDILVITKSFQVAASPIIMIIMFTLWTLIIIKFMYEGILEEWQQL